MKNTFGQTIAVTLFGESHGPAIGAVVDGIPSGIAVDKDYIAAKLRQRKSCQKISTGRRETDDFKIISGVFEGYTTGTPLCVIIENTDVDSSPYEKNFGVVRPSHADLAGLYKYGQYCDYRGGGHFSGRLTAALVAVGAILMKCLEDKGIFVGTHIKKCCKVCDRDFKNHDMGIKEDILTLSNLAFPVLDQEAAEKMIKVIQEAQEEGDSVGGILETVVCGVPAGMGEPWFDTVESMISHGIFAIPGVKGIEFGKGFEMASMKGSQANDSFRYREGKIITVTNNNGGINGGITNGMPVIFRTVVKPTPSIFKEQDTVDINKEENVKVTIAGRHDPAIVHRARAAVDAMTAITVADLLATQMGAKFLREK